ncbi:carbohydrate ABC transporter permease [Microbacterium sp. MYb62]|uniref:carbohydrate ABC transporter permease n=1 Tax=Microbacterium sp. MYb62 TaxID=1848690 RepID=UPI000CFD10E8|nr:carbohydrate ABC transporter permease [Microbacterium sp. MYb62]PRB09218.1 ABC transporter permease [Microbacterium sp. MYb62]
MTTQTETLVMLGRRSKPQINTHRARAAALRYVLMVLVLFVSLAPIVWPILTSFKAPGEDIFGANATVLPQDWSLFAYEKLFQDIPVLGYIGNSLTYAGLAITSQLIFATMGGYMLSRPGWRGRWLITVLVLSAMIFPFESIMLSLYTQVQMLGLLDTILGVWLPGFVSVFNVLILRSAFMAVPDALEEAAYIDGAGEFRRFFSIFLPAARGALVIVVLMSFIGAWDDLLWPLIALQSNENFTLTLGLATLNSSFGFDVRVILAGAVIALVPVVIIFLACQRHFFRGVEEGGVKF